ncbi:Isatin hydrolase [Paraburkholderia nemoris]|uniref:cyclase family protein n=1 Tax=Paraburkholderia nemoris TaxID=2793076 RepID=UPI00191154C7|nr:cyclase family protein [Paraburkholderia nemoris]MBK5151369.1 cyclase family protein [Burkholderia sp. R-69608]CAE6952090.1 Isatin hydrolase [Paraburkholderia nemoris]
MTILQQLANALAQRTVEVVDLTHTLESRIPVIGLPPQYRQTAPFALDEISNFDERGPSWYWNNFSCGEHTGTHFDAPVHWITGKDYPDGATDTISVQKMIAPACVIDTTDRVKENEDYLLTIADIEEWEEKHGRIPAGSWVLMRTGWSSRQYTDAFLNVREDGGHSPGPAMDVPTFLAKERDVVGFGTEPVGTDAGQAYAFAKPFPCHQNMHGSNKFGLSSLTNLDLLPPTGSILITPPLKIKRGSGSPCRVLALVERGLQL